MADKKTTDDLMQETLQKVFAAQILDALNGPQRDAILTKAVTNSLSGWDFKHTVESLIRERAHQKCKEIISSGAYDEEITRAIREGVEILLTRLPNATAKMLTEALFGEKKEGSYSQDKCGLILKFLTITP